MYKATLAIRHHSSCLFKIVSMLAMTVMGPRCIGVIGLAFQARFQATYLLQVNSRLVVRLILDRCCEDIAL